MKRKIVFGVQLLNDMKEDLVNNNISFNSVMLLLSANLMK